MKSLQWLLAFAGLAISSYLTAVHFQGVPLVCTTKGAINCNEVLTSPYASVGPVPVAIFGLVWFAVVVFALFFPAIFPANWRRLWTWAGALTVVYLVFTEVFRIGAICLWCSAVHVIVLALLVVGEVEVSRQGA